MPGRIKQVAGIAATFIGTVVGAGFASGQEIYQFFSRHGFYGIAGILLAILIMGAAGVKVFYFGAVLKAQSYKDLLEILLGPKLAKIFDVFILIFFIILVGVMFAGCGAIFEITGLGYWIGIILTGVFLIATLLKGLSGLISANLVIVPLMFIGCLGVSIYAAKNGNMANVHMITSGAGGLKWLLASLQFSAYNLVLSFPVLLSLGNCYPRKNQLKLGSWFGSAGLGIMAGFIYWAIILHPFLVNHELPMVSLAEKYRRLGLSKLCGNFMGRNVLYFTRRLLWGCPAFGGFYRLAVSFVDT